MEEQLKLKIIGSIIVWLFPSISMLLTMYKRLFVSKEEKKPMTVFLFIIGAISVYLCIDNLYNLIQKLLI